MRWKTERKTDRKMIRWLMFLGAGAALWFMFGSTPAVADAGPHVQLSGVVADGCASCHRLHTAKGPALLTQATQLALCYTCHGSTGTGAMTDVVTGRGYPDTTRGAGVLALRGGGFSSAMINSAAPGGQSDALGNATGTIPALTTSDTATSTHSVDGTSLTTWGNGALGTVGSGGSIALRCATCHDPHGNGNFRILRSIPTSSGGSSTPILDIGNKVYTTTNYWLVSATNNTNFIANVSAWCTTCHTRYLTTADGSARNALANEPIFTFRHKSNATAQNAPSCAQCHVAHGSNAAMGTTSNAVTLPDGTSAGTSSRLLRIDNRGTCQMCHLR